ncbi:hypothetical protein ACWEOE_22225, partial [Amycolatopsis sp. NPDC004368]
FTGDLTCLIYDTPDRRRCSAIYLVSTSKQALARQDDHGRSFSDGGTQSHGGLVESSSGRNCAVIALNCRGVVCMLSVSGCTRRGSVVVSSESGRSILALVLAGVVAVCELLLLRGEIVELSKHFNLDPGPYFHLLIGILALGVVVGAVLLMARRARAARVLLTGAVAQVILAVPGSAGLFDIGRPHSFDDVFVAAGIAAVIAVQLWIPAVAAAVPGLVPDVGGRGWPAGYGGTVMPGGGMAGMPGVAGWAALAGSCACRTTTMAGLVAGRTTLARRGTGSNLAKRSACGARRARLARHCASGPELAECGTTPAGMARHRARPILARHNTACTGVAGLLAASATGTSRSAIRAVVARCAATGTALARRAADDRVARRGTARSRPWPRATMVRRRSTRVDSGCAAMASRATTRATLTQPDTAGAALSRTSAARHRAARTTLTSMRRQNRHRCRDGKSSTARAATVPPTDQP